jgi:hypothetical protein
MDSSEWVISNTQQIQNMIIHASSEIRTRDSSSQAAADLCLWSHDRRDRLDIPTIRQLQ